MSWILAIPQILPKNCWIPAWGFFLLIALLIFIRSAATSSMCWCMRLMGMISCWDFTLRSYWNQRDLAHRHRNRQRYFQDLWVKQRTLNLLVLNHLQLFKWLGLGVMIYNTLSCTYWNLLRPFSVRYETSHNESPCRTSCKNPYSRQTQVDWSFQSSKVFSSSSR